MPVAAVETEEDKPDEEEERLPEPETPVEPMGAEEPLLEAPVAGGAGDESAEGARGEEAETSPEAVDSEEKSPILPRPGSGEES